MIRLSDGTWINPVEVQSIEPHDYDETGWLTLWFRNGKQATIQAVPDEVGEAIRLAMFGPAPLVEGGTHVDSVSLKSALDHMGIDLKDLWNGPTGDMRGEPTTEPTEECHFEPPPGGGYNCARCGGEWQYHDPATRYEPRWSPPSSRSKE